MPKNQGLLKARSRRSGPEPPGSSLAESRSPQSYGSFSPRGMRPGSCHAQCHGHQVFGQHGSPRAFARDGSRAFVSVLALLLVVRTSDAARGRPVVSDVPAVSCFVSFIGILSCRAIKPRPREARFIKS
jgi:hypothetical protein